MRVVKYFAILGSLLDAERDLVFSTLLTILLIALKLIHVNPVGEWSWVWVVCPMWISFAWKGGDRKSVV